MVPTQNIRTLESIVFIYNIPQICMYVCICVCIHICIYVYICDGVFFFCFSGTGFELRLHTCKAGILPFEPYFQSISLWLFWRWVSKSICLNWLQTMILPISASHVARITGHEHECLASAIFLKI
jgi:hypothetical protein